MSDVFEVEAIIDDRIGRRGETEFRIKWKGYPHSDDDTWEPYENLLTCKEKLNDYLTHHGSPAPHKKGRAVKKSVEKPVNPKKKTQIHETTARSSQQKKDQLTEKSSSHKTKKDVSHSPSKSKKPVEKLISASKVKPTPPKVKSTPPPKSKQPPSHSPPSSPPSKPKTPKPTTSTTKSQLTEPKSQINQQPQKPKAEQSPPPQTPLSPVRMKSSDISIEPEPQEKPIKGRKKIAKPKLTEIIDIPVTEPQPPPKKEKKKKEEVGLFDDAYAVEPKKAAPEKKPSAAQPSDADSKMGRTMNLPRPHHPRHFISRIMSGQFERTDVFPEIPASISLSNTTHIAPPPQMSYELNMNIPRVLTTANHRSKIESLFDMTIDSSSIDTRSKKTIYAVKYNGCTSVQHFSLDTMKQLSPGSLLHYLQQHSA